MTSEPKDIFEDVGRSWIGGGDDWGEDEEDCLTACGCISE